MILLSDLDWSTLPALLQLLLFFILWLLAWLPIAVPLAWRLQWRVGQPLTLSQKLPLLSVLYSIAPFLLWITIAQTQRSFRSLGWVWGKALWAEFGLGWVAGVLGLGLLLAIEWRLGWVQIHRSGQDFAKPLESPPIDPVPPGRLKQTLLSLLGILGLGIGIGLIEELIFRGYLQTTLQQDYSPLLAGAIGSIIFAVLHLIWEGRKAVPQLPGLWLMGMVLVIARWVSGGSLGLSWGLHAGWVWTIASLDTLGWLSYSQRVPAWVTGYGGSPIAGAMGWLFLGGLGVLLWQFLPQA